MEKSGYQEPNDGAPAKRLGTPSAVLGHGNESTSKPRSALAKWVATICIALLGFLLFSSVVNYRLTAPTESSAAQKAEPPRSIPPVIVAQSQVPPEGDRTGVVVGRTAEKPSTQAPATTWETPSLNLPALASQAELRISQAKETKETNSASAKTGQAAKVASPVAPTVSAPQPSTKIRETVSPILPYVEPVDPSTARSPAERAELERQVAARQAALSSAYSPSPNSSRPNRSPSTGVRETVTPIPPYVEVIDPSVAALSRPRAQSAGAQTPLTTPVVAGTSSQRAPTTVNTEANVPPACRGLTDLVLKQCQRCEPLNFFARGLCKEQVRKEYCAGRYGRDDSCVLEGYARGF